MANKHLELTTAKEVERCPKCGSADIQCYGFNGETGWAALDCACGHLWEHTAKGTASMDLRTGEVIVQEEADDG